MNGLKATWCGFCGETSWGGEPSRCPNCNKPFTVGEVVVTHVDQENKTVTMQAVKHDHGKPDLSMISWELVEEIAKVREFGAKKYARGNWMKGFKVTRSCAAALRHIFLFLKGETRDPESGLLHPAHAICALEHVIFDMKNHPENDDRDRKDT